MIGPRCKKAGHRRGVPRTVSSIFYADNKMKLNKEEWRKHVPVVALTVALFALLFAVFVLYPWHIQLSRQISRIR
jgi:hypothetical protein